MAKIELCSEALSRSIGHELGLSSWVSINQKRIDAFANCTLDHQWIHLDTERAAKESPFGTTIAHGFLTLSMLPHMNEQIGIFPTDLKAVINYGSDKLRFLAPVKAGSRIRNRVKLNSAVERPEGYLIGLNNQVEIENSTVPALVIDTLTLLVVGGSGD